MTEIRPPDVDDTEHEGRAALWLTFGLVLAQLGALIGVYLVLRSTRWAVRWKLAALAVPVVLVVMAKVAPEDGAASMFDWWFWIVWIAIVVGSTYTLNAAASRGSGHRGLGWLSGLVIAATLVTLASFPLSRLHRVGSYDYHDRVVAAAHDADAAGERYGVITESFFDSHDEHTVATAERLAGPGNARFATIFDELEANAGELETSKLSAKELGTCYVFPILSSRRKGIDSVTGLGRQCTGPSEAGSTLRLSNR